MFTFAIKNQMETERQREPKQGRGSPNVPSAHKPPEKGPHLLPSVSFIHSEGALVPGEAQGHLQLKWLIWLYTCQRVGALRTSAVAPWTGVQVTQDSWFGPAPSWQLRQSPSLLTTCRCPLIPKERGCTGATVHRLGKDQGRWGMKLTHGARPRLGDSVQRL